MVVPAYVRVIAAAAFAVAAHHVNRPQLVQFPQRAVYRRPRNLGHFLYQLDINFFRVWMVIRVGENFEYRSALRGDLIPLAPKSRDQFFCFVHNKL